MDNFPEHDVSVGEAPEGFLFDPGEAAERPAAEREQAAGTPRLRSPIRTQYEYRELMLDELLPEDHQTRVIWEYVVCLDLSELLEQIASVEGHAGRSAIDPRILLTLWLQATLDGIGSARKLDELCKKHVVYQWICGGVSVNYHTLSDFRVGHVELLDRLLTDSVAALRHEGLVDLHRVAQDGMRVRASAGAASFRRKPTLEECLQEAEKQMERLRQEAETDPAAGSRREQSARQRAAQERAERIREAMRQLPRIAARKKVQDREQARCSTTDPDARTMKMADGGFRPAFNVQFSTDTATQVILGVDVVNTVDQGQLAPMVDQIEARYDERPQEVLVDGGFGKKADIESLDAQGTTVYTPVMESKDPDRDEHTPRPDDKPSIAAWRQRMATDEAKEIYKQRASTAECVNALARQRGLTKFVVRGLRKVKAATLWYVLAHNLMRSVALRARAQLKAASEEIMRAGATKTAATR